MRDPMIYGYCRISTPTQSIDRQVRNIKREYPDATIIQEIYTGREFQGRDKLKRLYEMVKPKDMIVFDSVSRMSRNADEGVKAYFELFDSKRQIIRWLATINSIW